MGIASRIVGLFRLSACSCVLLCAGVSGCGGGADDPVPPTEQPVEQVLPDSQPGTYRATTADDALPDDSSPPALPAEQDDPPVRPTAQPQPIFRASDTRPRHDDAKLAARGIRAYESKRLKLYTDIDAKLAAKLPPLIDAAYKAWEEYFGKLPANRERTEFQMTGYLMKDAELFRDAGLIPGDLRPFENGRHRGAEFWMNDQTYDYYRRHLVIHEATHCFMEAIAGERYYEGLPAWYWEGMAELFGTHQIDAAGKVSFRVMPDNREDFAGLGRITIVQDAVEAGEQKSVVEVARLGAADFIGNDAYAWSWSLCKFLDTHPAYSKRFHEFGGLLTGSRFMRAWGEFLKDYQGQLPAEWSLFAADIQYGYDIERAAIDFQAGKPLASDGSDSKAKIRADAGWQSSGVRIDRGRKYMVTADGQFTLAQQPKPWVSDAGGISFDYFGGRPLGLLLARVHSEDAGFLPVFAAGRRLEFVAPANGTLYFRLNDSWSRLADNQGEVTVSVSGLVDETSR